MQPRVPLRPPPVAAAHPASANPARPAPTMPSAGEALPRLLGRWGVRPVPAASLAQQLGDRLAWADAIALSQVLAAPLPTGAAAVAPAQREARRQALAWAEAALDRLLTELQAGFADELLSRESATQLPPQAPAFADLWPPYQLHLSQHQRGMAARVAGLRERLRGQLAGASPALARLAALDAVFDRGLAAQERQALAGLPPLMLQRAQAHHRADPRGWRAPLWTDLQHALQAELTLRLQPVQGLIQALRQAVAADAAAPSPTPEPSR